MGLRRGASSSPHRGRGDRPQSHHVRLCPSDPLRLLPEELRDRRGSGHLSTFFPQSVRRKWRPTWSRSLQGSGRQTGLKKELMKDTPDPLLLELKGKTSLPFVLKGSGQILSKCKQLLVLRVTSSLEVYVTWLSVGTGTVAWSQVWTRDWALACCIFCGHKDGAVFPVILKHFYIKETRIISAFFSAW